jgi:transmembrane 9 superfamily protein 3
MVGEVVPEPEAGIEKYFIYTHSNFVVTYNKDRIIEVNLTTENPVQLVKETEITYTYSISWHETELSFEDRFEKYLDYNFFEHQVTNYL